MSNSNKPGDLIRAFFERSKKVTSFIGGDDFRKFRNRPSTKLLGMVGITGAFFLLNAHGFYSGIQHGAGMGSLALNGGFGLLMGYGTVHSTKRYLEARKLDP